MAFTITIKGVDYSSGLNRGYYTSMDQTYRMNHSNPEMIDDSSNTLATALQVVGVKQLILKESGVAVFTGAVEDWRPNEAGNINIYSIGYSLQMNGDPITTYDCNGQTASGIITALINTYGGGLFTSSIIATTTTTYDDIFRYMTPMEIMQELALRESFYLRLSPALQWIFDSRSSNDLGLTYAEGTDFFTPSIKKTRNRIKNSYYIIDNAGQPYKKQDLLSIGNNMVRTGFLDAPDATSESQVRAYLNARISKNSDVLTPAMINIPQNLNVIGTGLIRMNYAQLGWVNKQVYITGVTHSLTVPDSKLELVNYDSDMDEALNDLLYDRRQLQKRNIDTSLDLIILADVLLEIGVTLSVVVEKQSGTNFVWNESGQSDATIWNSTPTAWTELVSSSTVIPMTAMLTRLRDLLQGEAVTLFDASNTTIELGSGTTSVQVTDTALDTAISGTDASMDAGYPRNGADAEMLHQVSYSDSDIISFTSQEIGIKVDGTLMARVKLDSSFAKAADEVIRVRNTTAFSDVDPTKIMTRFLNRIRDLAQGKSVQALDNANTIIEYGSGITAVTATDTDLANDSISATRKSMDASYPQDGLDDISALFKTSITDVDISTFAAYELGMFENANLLFRYVLASVMNKAAGENINTEIKISFVET